MTIDWTQPVETTEDPPRPVRVLFDKDGRPEAVHINDNGSSPSFNLFAIEHIGAGVNATRGMYSITLRNVAPPKPEPVLREVWVWWNSHGKATLSLNEEWCVHQRTVERGVYARVAVMSDGSPVPGEGHTNCWANYNLMVTDRDEWRTKAESLQAEEEKLREELVRRSAKADDAMAAVQKVKPVVDAAVAGVDSFNRRGLLRLIEAVRTYQKAPKKSAAEAVANVAAMMEPVKNCTTCSSTATFIWRTASTTGISPGGPIAITDYNELIERLISEANDTKYMLGHASSLHTAAADAIKELVADNGDLSVMVEKEAAHRAQAEADLAAARKALLWAYEALPISCAVADVEEHNRHQAAIAAARAEGGKNDPR